jgi:hypothetical protein
MSTLKAIFLDKMNTFNSAFTTTTIARLKSNAKEISVYLLSSKVDDFARK